MYRLPKPLTEDAVRALMKDPRYQDRGHPEHRGFTDFVTSAFRSLYPEPEKKFIRIGACTAEPDTIISDDTPTWMRERGMMLSAGTDDGSISARTPKLAAPKLPPRPGMLTDPPPPRLISPVPDATIRPKDDWARKGSGFWAERKSGDELRPHKGIDQVAAPGIRVIAPVGGKMTRFRVYSDERKAEMMGIRIKADDGHEVDTFSVDVDPKLENESRVEPGDVIGKVQDVSGLYRRLNPNIGPMTNHVHLQVKNPKGEYVDPTSYVTGWALSQGHPERRNK